MTLQESMERRILSTLKASPQGLTRTQLLARVLHYRALPDKFLFFSVRERALLKHVNGPQYDEAEHLLRHVLGELAAIVATPQMQSTLALREARATKQAKRKARNDALFEAPPPPPPVIVTPARRILVSGTPTGGALSLSALYKQLAPPAQVGRILSEQFRVPGAELARTLASMGMGMGVGMGDPVYQTVPAETKPHPYVAVSDEVETAMLRHPAVVWSRLPIERELRDDQRIKREYESRKRSLNRAVDSLERNGFIDLVKERKLTIVRIRE